MQLTAIILTLNEASHIVDCIDSLRWADKIVVFDSHSQDETVALATQAGAVVLQSRFENYAQQRNAALARVSADWVFFVDADERATPAVATEVRRVINARPESGWYIPRHNYIFGRLTRGAGWFPDYQLRLFRQGKVHYERPVHEVAVVDGAIGHLAEPLIHYNYRDIAQFHATQRRYTAYEAGILAAEGVRPKPYTPLLQPLRHFWWRFVTLHGYRDQWHGLRLSALMAYYEYRKIRALQQLTRHG